MKNLKNTLALGFLALSLSACSSLQMRDFNRVETGMTRTQAEKILGEPVATRTIDGRTVLEYAPKDDNGDKLPRWLVLEDKEVIFFGRPADYHAQMEAKAALKGSNGGGASVNNSVAPVIAPVFNNYGSGASQAAPQQPIAQYAPQAMYMPPMPQYAAPAPQDRLIWVHDAPNGGK
jgi:hypothetical protein